MSFTEYNFRVGFNCNTESRIEFENSHILSTTGFEYNYFFFSGVSSMAAAFSASICFTITSNSASVKNLSSSFLFKTAISKFLLPDSTTSNKDRTASLTVCSSEAAISSVYSFSKNSFTVFPLLPVALA